MGLTLSKLAYWKAWTDRDTIWAEDRLPSASLPSYDNLKSSFFQTRLEKGSAPRLPSPEEILQRNAGEGYGVLKYESLNLVVKYGAPSELRIDGAVAMHATQQAFSKDDFPVPELFGWRTYEGKSFIYMELLPGTNLSQAWSDLTNVEKTSIAGELKRLVGNLRSIKQPRDCNHIGTFSSLVLQSLESSKESADCSQVLWAVGQFSTTSFVTQTMKARTVPCLTSTTESYLQRSQTALWRKENTKLRFASFSVMITKCTSRMRISTSQM